MVKDAPPAGALIDTVGAVVSVVPPGLLVALPGKVPAVISARFVKPSTSESTASSAALYVWLPIVELAKLLPNAFLVPPEAPWQTVHKFPACPDIVDKALNGEAGYFALNEVA